MLCCVFDFILPGGVRSDKLSEVLDGQRNSRAKALWNFCLLVLALVAGRRVSSC